MMKMTMLNVFDKYKSKTSNENHSESMLTSSVFCLFAVTTPLPCARCESNVCDQAKASPPSSSNPYIAVPLVLMMVAVGLVAYIIYR